MNAFFERHFAAIFVVSCAVGFVFPGADELPPSALAWLLGAQLFVSSFKISLGEVRLIRLRQAVAFYLLRFLLFPILCYWCVAPISGIYGVGVFLLCLLPAGVTSPAFAGVFGGSVSLSFLLVVLSSLLAPFVIPAAFQLMFGLVLDFDAWSSFRIMAGMIFLPLVLHLPLRFSKSFSAWIQQNNPLIVVPLVAIMSVCTVAQRREMILLHPTEALWLFLAALCLFFFFGAFGWLVFSRSSMKTRISYTLASGLNNTGLGVVLALLLLPKEVGLFLVVSSIAWFGVLVVVQHIRYVHQT